LPPYSRAMRQIFFLLLLVSLPAVVTAQDAQFSQFFASPTTLNPALTGLFAGRYRIALSHRSQWGQVLPSAYSTSAFAADFRYALNPKRRGGDSFGAGVYFLNDRVSEVGLSNNQFMFSGAFHKSLDGRGEQLLSIGGQLGVVQRSLGYGDLTFQDEFDGVTGFVGGSGGEQLPENSVSFGDFQLGLNYSLLPRRRGIGFFAGLALHHLTRPELSFYAQETADDPVQVTNTLYRRYSAYVNLRIPTGSDAQLSPRLYVLKQGPHTVINAGSNLRLLLEDASGTAIHLGAWLRLVDHFDGLGPDSAVGLVGFEVSSFLFGLSYDVGISGRRVSPRHRGAFELSVTYIGLSEDDQAVPCPQF